MPTNSIRPRRSGDEGQPKPADLFAELATAKNNVRWLLDHSEGLVDMHTIVYWAGRVESLRSQIREVL